jgi:hypothetical protein
MTVALNNAGHITLSAEQFQMRTESGIRICAKKLQVKTEVQFLYTKSGICYSNQE